jgi:hypothetical protein
MAGHGADEAVGGIWRSDAARQAIGGYVERVLRRG